MSWESVDTLPTAQAVGSPYQGAVQPIVAQRAALSVVERARLFWRSTPELPSGRAARVVVLTPNHLYVQRVDKTHQRVALGALRGRRQAGALVVYGVVDGEDLALLLRRDCPVIRALDARFRGTETSALQPIEFREGHVVALGLALAASMLSTYLLVEYPIESMWDRIHRGLYTAEVVLGTVGGFAAALAALLFLLFVPVHWRIDSLGVHRARGFVGWLHYLDPPDDFRAVVTVAIRGKQPGHTVHRVQLVRRAEGQLGLHVRSFLDSPSTTPAEGEAEARALAKHAGQLLDLPVRS